ncbi:MAG: hypothetical protein Q4E36_05805 [Bacillota bacterium]|nr:hypothetical protein [Bacillota bacterium]
MKSLENYKKDIQSKISFMVIVVILALLAVLFSTLYLKNQFPAKADVTDYVIGFFVGIEVMSLVYMGVLIRALKDENLLKKMYLKETDEREILIRMKSGASIVPIFSILMLIATLIVVYFSFEAFITLVVVAILQLIVSLALKIYWSKRI